jgi:hypothetical protein
MDPTLAIADLNELKKMALPNNTYKTRTSEGYVITYEGNEAIEDAINYLKGLKKSYPLFWSDGLYNSTKAYV